MRFVTWYGDSIVALLEQPDQAKLAYCAFVLISERLEMDYNLFFGY